MTKAEIAKIIYMSGVFGEYTVHTHGYCGLAPLITLSDATMGHALVKTIRARVYVVSNTPVWKEALAGHLA